MRRDAAATARAFPAWSSRPTRSSNYVDHTVTDQSSIIRFIEDNWLGGQRITGSFDSLAGTLNGMFDFKSEPNKGVYLLDPSTGLGHHRHGDGDGGHGSRW